MSISAPEAAEVAANYYKSVTQIPGNLSVEEIEKDNAETVWLITLGISEPNFSINMTKNKEYKLFKIDINSSEVLSMKIRKV